MASITSPVAAHSVLGKRKLTTEPLRVGGVPEHFNLPFTYAQAKYPQLFTFIEQKCGTGEMITKLKAGELDVIVALTEGLVSEIAKQQVLHTTTDHNTTSTNEMKLLGTYVESPLTWAISSGRDAPFESIQDLQGKKFGISRFTSGSHLMAIVLALQRGWNPNTEVSFEVKGNFENLRNSVNDGSTDAFMWETFMTKPFHDSNVIKRVGEISTPWPCFMIATLKETVDDRLNDLQQLLQVVQQAALEFSRDEEHMPAVVAEKFGLRLEDAKLWYSQVRITGADMVSESALERTIRTLIEAGVLPANVNQDDLELYLDTRICHLHRDIRSMKLYNQQELVTSLHCELKAANLERGKISFTSLLPYDQHHYHGVQEIDQTAKELSLTQGGKRVINIGSGLGGPARYLAGQYHNNVLAVELQEELSRTASELTERCSLSDSVTHLAGDFAQVSRHLQPCNYDSIVSWLTVLHIVDRRPFFNACYDLLKPGGYFFAADFFARNTLSKHERKILADDVWCRYLPSLEHYKRDLEAAGFHIVQVDDCSEDWTVHTSVRVSQFEQSKDRHISVTGLDNYLRRHYFYDTIAKLFKAGNVGGVRIRAMKPE